MRFVPVVAGADVDRQRHLEVGDALHDLGHHRAGTYEVALTAGRVKFHKNRRVEILPEAS